MSNIHPIFQAINDADDNATTLRWSMIGEINQYLQTMSLVKLAIIQDIASNFEDNHDVYLESNLTELLNNVGEPITIGKSDSETQERGI